MGAENLIIRKPIWIALVCLVMCSTARHPRALASAGEYHAMPRSRARTPMFRLDTMCGPNCVWQIAKALGKDCTPKDIAEFAGTNASQGTTIKGLVQACKTIGLPAEAVRTNLNGLRGDSRVAILLLETNDLMHYVILDRIGDNQVRLLDANKFQDLSIEELKSSWAGCAILVGHNEGRPPSRLLSYLATGLQISGLSILLVGVAYGAKLVYIHSQKRSP